MFQNIQLDFVAAFEIQNIVSFVPHIGDFHSMSFDKKHLPYDFNQICMFSCLKADNNRI